MLNRGNLIIISAPSGSGKTSLASRVLEQVPDLEFSVSHTTRSPRGEERDGVEYFFIEEEQFQGMIERDEFLEFAHVYGNYYGTSAAFVQRQQASGKDVLLDIDIQGARKVKSRIPDAVTIFVLPPSFQELEDRLRNRGLDDPHVVEGRLQIAREEIRHFRQYDYLVINEDIEKSVHELQSIVLAARCRTELRVQRAEQIVGTFADRSQKGAR